MSQIMFDKLGNVDQNGPLNKQAAAAQPKRVNGASQSLGVDCRMSAIVG
jgi:hypothetical protein